MEIPPSFSFLFFVYCFSFLGFFLRPLMTYAMYKMADIYVCHKTLYPEFLLIGIFQN